MKKDYDEPAFLDVVREKRKPNDHIVGEEIRNLCRAQPFAVLATQDEGQPYTSLISIAVSGDLGNLVFSTPSKTRKFSHLLRNNQVSLLIDSRSSQPESINSISAVTAIRPGQGPRGTV